MFPGDRVNLDVAETTALRCLAVNRYDDFRPDVALLLKEQESHLAPADPRARSGLAITQGLGMVNSPGTIDSDYRGEIKVILINWGEEPRIIRLGDRFDGSGCQLIWCDHGCCLWISD